MFRTVSASNDQRLFGTVAHDLVGQGLKMCLVGGHLGAWDFGCQKGGSISVIVIYRIVGERVGVHVQPRPDALERLEVALLRQDDKATDQEELGVEVAPMPAAVTDLVLLAPPANLRL